MIKILSGLNGVSGCEDDVRKYISQELDGYCDDIYTDTIGNLFAYSKAKSVRDTIVITACMDETGIIITDITDDGYLRFETIGKIDASSLISQRVKIEDVSGIISLKAIHLTTRKEREKPVKLSELFVDIGARSKREAEEAVCIGDLGVFDTECVAFGNGFIKGKALSGRSGCKILIDVLKKSSKPDINILAVFLTQNNTASRGMLVAANSVPECKFILNLVSTDATPLKDNDIKSDAGIVLYKNLYYSAYAEKVYNGIKKLLEENEYKYQICADTVGSYKVLKEVKSGADIIDIGIPCRYTQTGVNVISSHDVADAEKVVNLILRSVENGEL